MPTTLKIIKTKFILILFCKFLILPIFKLMNVHLVYVLVQVWHVHVRLGHCGCFSCFDRSIYYPLKTYLNRMLGNALEYFLNVWLYIAATDSNWGRDTNWEGGRRCGGHRTCSKSKKGIFSLTNDSNIYF